MDTLSSWGVVFRDVANPLPSPSIYYFVGDGILGSTHSCVWVLCCVNALRTLLTDVYSVCWDRRYHFLLFFTLFICLFFAEIADVALLFSKAWGSKFSLTESVWLYSLFLCCLNSLPVLSGHIQEHIHLLHTVFPPCTVVCCLSSLHP